MSVFAFQSYLVHSLVSDKSIVFNRPHPMLKRQASRFTNRLSPVTINPAGVLSLLVVPNHKGSLDLPSAEADVSEG